MRKLIFGINVTLDGNCDHTKVNAAVDLHEYFTQLLRESDVLVYGRKTYQLMVPFWTDMAKDRSGPTESMNEFAQAFAAVDKIVVFSRTLESGETKNTRIVSGDLRDEILKLKHEDGKNIMLGGVDVPSQIIKFGLVDEYHIVVHPVIAGEGTRLLKGISLPEKLDLKLLESKVLSSGAVALHYVKQP
jgi:dihydrofolate reductase